MSPFYVEGDRKIMQVKPRPSHLCASGRGSFAGEHVYVRVEIEENNLVSAHLMRGAW